MLKPIRSNTQLEDYMSRAYALMQLDQQGLERNELQRILGYRSRASEILSGKRKVEPGYD